VVHVAAASSIDDRCRDPPCKVIRVARVCDGDDFVGVGPALGAQPQYEVEVGNIVAEVPGPNFSGEGHVEQTGNQDDEDGTAPGPRRRRARATSHGSSGRVHGGAGRLIEGGDRTQGN